MTIIQQLFEFIIHRREVKDIDYSQNAAIGTIILDAVPIILATYFINQTALENGGIKIDDITINHIPMGLVSLYSITFTALFFCLFAAQQRQTRFMQAATAFFGTSVLLTLVHTLLTSLPGAGIFGIVIFALKISCSVRVLIEALDYSVPRAVFSLIGISMMSMLMATLIFPPDITRSLLAQ